jgi:perosamine synthetase
MDEINEIAARKGIVVLEDAAHAIGATYKGRAIGSISRLTAFSFQAIKHLTTGDGGALACTTEDDERLAKKLRWFGIDRADSPVNTLGEREYDLTELGYKYHMNNLGAALGLGNLEDLETRLTSRNRIVERLRSGLKGTPGLALLSRSSDRQSADWLFIVLVERRESFVERMKERGIPVTVVHNRIDHNTLFGGLRKDLFAMADFDSRQISLPCHEQLRDEDVDAIIAAVKAGW